MKLVCDEPESDALASFVVGAGLVSSQLVLAEVPRAIRRPASEEPRLQATCESLPVCPFGPLGDVVGVVPEIRGRPVPTRSSKFWIDHQADAEGWSEHRPTSTDTKGTPRTEKHLYQPCDGKNRPATCGRLRITIDVLEIHSSARRHGVSDEDIRHAIAHALTIDILDPETDSERLLVLGPDRAANMLEIVLVLLDEDESLAIHAMRMRPMYKRLLPEGG